MCIFECIFVYNIHEYSEHVNNLHKKIKKLALNDTFCINSQLKTLTSSYPKIIFYPKFCELIHSIERARNNDMRCCCRCHSYSQCVLFVWIYAND